MTLIHQYDQIHAAELYLYIAAVLQYYSSLLIQLGEIFFLVPIIDYW